MAVDSRSNTVSVAEAKARFSELIDRVQQGERFVIARRGRPVLALVPPDQAAGRVSRPIGLAAIAGVLADWAELDETVQEIYAARRRAADRNVPELD
jgi:prevent-host-death family protein